MRIALAGNPNSGKTTMYNALTGRNEKVGNWAGVTVEKIEHSVRARYAGDNQIIAVDLPGAYSMSPFTSEESVASEYVRGEHPDVIINIVDATNLSRSLFFTTQLLELGIPVVVALNKTDASTKRRSKIDTQALSARLGCPVFETVSTTAKGLVDLMCAAVQLQGCEQSAPYHGADGYSEDKEAAEAADRQRFEFVKDIVLAVQTKEDPKDLYSAQDKLDAILMDSRIGLPIFAVVMFLVFLISQWEFGPGVLLANLLVGWLESGQELIATAINSDGIFASILVDGIIGGFIAIVGFLPLVMVMYFLIALLEECGYMARATVVLDPIFKRVGLSGKSVIPFVIGTGCAVPGVMACRTIRDEREKRTTAMLAPFMPCGAKLPVIALFAGVFFGDSAWVGALMYFVGILIILLAAMLINALNGYRPRGSFFIIELPDYKAPSLGKALKTTAQRGWSFVVKAGTVILLCNFIVHVMQNFGWTLSPVDNPDDSILAYVARPFAYIFAPVVGFVSWQLAAASITGFIAKENVVGTLAVCFGITNLLSADTLAIESGAEVSKIALAFGTGSGGAMLSATALAFLMFNLFTPPCFAAIGAMNSEIKSKRVLFSAVGLQFSVGYSLGFLVNFFGSLFTDGLRGESWTYIVGWIAVLVIAAIYATAILIKRREARRGESNDTKPLVTAA